MSRIPTPTVPARYPLFRAAVSDRRRVPGFATQRRGEMLWGAAHSVAVRAGWSRMIAGLRRRVLAPAVVLPLVGGVVGVARPLWLWGVAHPVAVRGWGGRG